MPLWAGSGYRADSAPEGRDEGTEVMARKLYVFDHPDRFIAGTVGPPGARTFFLQVVQGRRVVSVSLEKEQVAVLAERVNDLLDELSVGEDLPVAQEDNGPLTRADRRRIPGEHAGSRVGAGAAL